MKKDFAKKKFAAKQSNSILQKKWMVLFSFIVILAGGAGFYLYQPKSAVLATNKLSSYYQSANQWVVERKTHLQNNLVKVKQIAVAKKDAKQEIHFEFYTTLQNMQVPVPDTNVQINDTHSVANIAAKKKPAKSHTIFDADKLQMALNDEFKQIHKNKQ